MTAGAFQFYDSFKEAIADGSHDLDTNTFKLALVTSSYTFSAAHTIFTDITNELPTANGYTAGGEALVNVTWAQVSGTAKFDADDVVWNAAGGAITARRAVLYDDTSAGKKLIGSFLLNDIPADVTAASGNPLSVIWDVVNGIFTLV